MDQNENTARRAAARVISAIVRGAISLVNDTSSVQRLQVRVSALSTPDNIPRLAEYGLTSNPPADSDAVLLSVGGDLSNSVVIATGNAKYRLTGLSTGEVAIHDDKGQSVYLSAAGIVVKGGGLPITLTDTPEITADTPLLKCTGDILDNCNSNTRTVAGMREVANSHTHDVLEVQGGGSTIVSQPPNQPE